MTRWDLIYSFYLTEKNPYYSVKYKGTVLIDRSALGFSFEKSGDFGENLSMLKPSYCEQRQTYNLVVGKTKSALDNHRQVIIPLVELNGAKRQINLVVRAFNDGIAFRYEFPKQEHWKSYVMLDEKSTFNLAQNPTVHALFWDTFSNSHEGLYVTLPYREVQADKMMDLPTLFEFPNKIYIAITEANLRNYAGMYLKKNLNGSLTSQLSLLPNQKEQKVKATLPHSTPWRVMMIGDQMATLMESNI
ncbi:MAG: glycoside hydrolase family 97 N-terminal domain-containing protein [Pedobacter sp.]|nr:glycoside hydrolase family 97 N-terminal domain-containing protein [Pedobacter sp.]